MKTGRFIGIAVAVVLLLGAILRAAVYADSRDWIVLTMPVLDAGYYHETARGLLDGSWPGDTPYFMGPLYSYVMAFLYRLFGEDLHVVRVAQMTLGLLGAALVARVAFRLFGGGAAIAATALAVLYGPWLFFEQLPLMAALLAVLSILFVESLLIWRSSGAVGWGIGTGALLGLLTAMRATGALFLLPAIPALRGRVSTRRALLALLAAVVVLAPFALHNRSAGSRALLSTNLGWNLFVGHGPQANGMFVYPNGWRAHDDPTGRAFASVRAGRTLTPDETNAFWLSSAWDSMRGDPLRVLTLTAKKAWLAIQAGEIPQNESFRFFRIHTPTVRVAFVDWWLIVPLACLGLWVPVRDVVGRRVVLASVLIPLIVCVLFFVTTRYRLPAVPGLIVLAGGGIAWLVEQVKRGETRDVALRGGGVLIGMVALFFASIVVPPVNADRALAREYEHLGLRYQQVDALRAAVTAYQSAVEINPDDGDAYNNLGTVLLRLERLEEAEVAFQKATRVTPENPIPFSNLGLLLGRLGRDAEAEAAFRRAHELDPSNVETILQLGTSMALQNKLEAAAEKFELVLEIDPTHALAREYLIGARELLELPSNQGATR